MVGEGEKSTYIANLIFNGQKVKINIDITIKGAFSYLNNANLEIKTIPTLEYNEEVSSLIPGIINFYLIHGKDTKKYKIGISDDPLKKLTDLQEDNPFELEIVACCPVDTGLEDSIKKQYKQGPGGWFTLKEKEVQDIITQIVKARIIPHREEVNLPARIHFEEAVPPSVDSKEVEGSLMIKVTNSDSLNGNIADIFAAFDLMGLKISLLANPTASLSSLTQVSDFLNGYNYIVKGNTVWNLSTKSYTLYKGTLKLLFGIYLIVELAKEKEIWNLKDNTLVFQIQCNKLEMLSDNIVYIESDEDKKILDLEDKSYIYESVKSWKILPDDFVYVEHGEYKAIYSLEEGHIFESKYDKVEMLSNNIILYRNKSKLKLFNIRKDKKIFKLFDEDVNFIQAISFPERTNTFPKGFFIITIDNQIRIHSLYSGRLIQTIELDIGIYKYDIIPNDRIFVTSEKGAGVWDLITGENMCLLETDIGKIANYYILPNDTILRVVDYKATVWNFSGELLCTLDGDYQWYKQPIILPNNKIMNQVPFGRDSISTTKICDLSDGKCSDILGGNYIRYLHFESIISNNYAVFRSYTHHSQTNDRPNQIWDLRINKCIYPSLGKPDTLMILPDKRIIIVSDTKPNTIEIWDFENGGLIFTLIGDSYFRQIVDNFIFTYTKDSYNGIIRIYSLKDGKCIHTLPDSNTPFSVKFEFLSDEHLLATSSVGFWIWNLKTDTFILKCDGQLY